MSVHYLFSSKLTWRYPFHSREELAERGTVGKMEAVGYLGDAHRRGAKQERGFHQEHLVDVVDDSTPRDLTNDAGEIDLRDVEPGGIEGDVAVLGKMLGQETDETNKDFLYTLGRLTVGDGLLLGVLHVEQEDGIKHAQYLIFIDMVGVQVGDYFAHPCGQMLRRCVRQCQFRLVQLHDGPISDVHQVAHGGYLNSGVLIGHQAKATIVL